MRLRSGTFFFGKIHVGQYLFGFAGNHIVFQVPAPRNDSGYTQGHFQFLVDFPQRIFRFIACCNINSKNIDSILFGWPADNEFIKRVGLLEKVCEGNRLFFSEYHFYKSGKTFNLWKRILIRIIILICRKQTVEQTVSGLVFYICYLSFFIKIHYCLGIWYRHVAYKCVVSTEQGYFLLLEPVYDKCDDHKWK